MRDCTSSVTPNSNEQNYEFLSCQCNVGYHWDYKLAACVRYQNCKNMAHSTGINADSNSCVCNEGYEWNSTWKSLDGGACQRKCSTKNYTFGVGATDPDTCTCNNGYSWSTTSYVCILNCSAIPSSTGAIDGAGCKCNSNYRWDSIIGQCVSSSSNHALAIGLGVGIPLGILAILGLIALLLMCCKPAAAAPVMMGMPMAQSMSPLAVPPQVITSRVMANPVTTTQIVRPAANPISQTIVSTTKVGGIQPGVGGMTSYTVGGINPNVTSGVNPGFGPTAGPSYVGRL